MGRPRKTDEEWREDALAYIRARDVLGLHPGTMPSVRAVEDADVGLSRMGASRAKDHLGTLLLGIDLDAYIDELVDQYGADVLEMTAGEVEQLERDRS